MRDTSWREERTKKYTWVKLIVTVVVLVALVFFAVQYFTRPKAATNETATITNKLSKVMLLPSGEPTLTTVNKTGDLKKQAFFANVQRGDKVLIYVKARKIIIYRPSTNMIINVGPILNDTATNSNTTQ